MDYLIASYDPHGSYSGSILKPPPIGAIYIYIYIWCGGFWFQLLGCQGARARVILVLCECIWNVHAVSLVLSYFDDISSLGSPSRQVVYLPGSILVDYLPFPYGE